MGRAWTKDEESILEGICNSKASLVSQMHRLPGRSWDAAKSHASRMGFALSRARKWSLAEQAILREIWTGRAAIKLGLRRLPGRSYASAKAEAARIRLTGARMKGRTGYSWLEPVVKSVLVKESPMTIARIADVTGASISGIENILRMGHGSTFHVADWYRKSAYGDYARMWALGVGPDAPKPARKSPAMSHREWAQRKRVQMGAINPFASLVQQVAA